MSKIICTVTWINVYTTNVINQTLCNLFESGNNSENDLCDYKGHQIKILYEYQSKFLKTRRYCPILVGNLYII